MATVCVTGGGGFIGSHIVYQLLEQGYHVHATTRSLAKADSLRKALVPNHVDGASDRLTFHQADLEYEAGWQDAMSGCRYLIHVASPLPLAEPKDENELIRPAVEGTLRVLRFALGANVERVVLTSSVAAIAYGHKDYSVVHDETHWTDTEALGSVGAYFKSKTLAERAAWRFVKDHPTLELSVINPYTVFGPILPGITDIGASVGIIQAIITRSMWIAPVFEMAAVDVRDVATMHIIAMTSPAAKGERFIAAAGQDGRAEMFTLQRIAADMRYKVRSLPDWGTRLVAYVSPETKPLTLAIGYKRHLSNEKAQRVLDVRFRSLREAIDASVESLRERGVK